MSCIKTKTGENTITFDVFYQYIWARNYGDTDVYISNHNNIVAGDDDVALLPAGEAVRLTVNGKTLYVLGSTTLEVHAQNFSDSPFAWNEAGEGGGSDITVVALSATENKTYTAPSGTAYSPVTVNVPTGAEIITRSDWNALTTAQKQAKGLVAIQDASTGYMRGIFVNGADYHDTLLPYSVYSDILEEDKSSTHESGTSVWGGLTLSGVMDNDADDAVITDGKIVTFDLSAANEPVTIYALMKRSGDTESGNRTMIGVPYAMSGNNLPNIFCNGSTVYTSVYGSDDSISGISATDYVLYTMAIDAISKKVDFYANGVLKRSGVSFSNSGGHIVFGAAETDLTNVISCNIKYIGIVDGYEQEHVITNNHVVIMNEYGL